METIHETNPGLSFHRIPRLINLFLVSGGRKEHEQRECGASECRWRVEDTALVEACISHCNPLVSLMLEDLRTQISANVHCCAMPGHGPILLCLAPGCLGGRFPGLWGALAGAGGADIVLHTYQVHGYARNPPASPASLHMLLPSAFLGMVWCYVLAGRF